MPLQDELRETASATQAVTRLQKDLEEAEQVVCNLEDEEDEGEGGNEPEMEVAKETEERSNDGTAGLRRRGDANSKLHIAGKVVAKCRTKLRMTAKKAAEQVMVQLAAAREVLAVAVRSHESWIEAMNKARTSANTSVQAGSEQTEQQTLPLAASQNGRSRGKRGTQASRPGASKVSDTQLVDLEPFIKAAKELVDTVCSELLRPPSDDQLQYLGASAWLLPQTKRAELAKWCNECLLEVGLPGVAEHKRSQEAFTPKNVIDQMQTEDGQVQLCQLLKTEHQKEADEVMREHRMLHEENQQNEVESEPTPLALTCPLSKGRLTFPTRTIHCSHPSCFDLLSYFQTNKGDSSRNKKAWKCPICWKSAQWNELFFDGYMHSILAATSAESVTVHPDGRWEETVQDAVHVLNLDSEDEEEPRRDQGTQGGRVPRQGAQSSSGGCSNVSVCGRASTVQEQINRRNWKRGTSEGMERDCVRNSSITNCGNNSDSDDDCMIIKAVPCPSAPKLLGAEPSPCKKPKLSGSQAPSLGGLPPRSPSVPPTTASKSRPKSWPEGVGSWVKLKKSAKVRKKGIAAGAPQPVSKADIPRAALPDASASDVSKGPVKAIACTERPKSASDRPRVVARPELQSTTSISRGRHEVPPQRKETRVSEEASGDLQERRPSGVHLPRSLRLPENLSPQNVSIPQVR